MVSPALLFLLRITLAFGNLIPLNFRPAFFSYVKNVIVILVEILLSLKDIFSNVDFLNNKEQSFHLGLTEDTVNPELEVSGWPSFCVAPCQSRIKLA